MTFSKCQNKGDFKMFCKVCGKEINDQAVICPHCGCAVEKKQEEVEKPISILSILGFVLGLVGIFFSYYLILPIAGLVISICGVYRAKKCNQKLAGLGIAGIVLSSVWLFICICVLAFIGNVLMAL